MKIIIDAMGGDNAPRAFLEGGFRAADELGVEVVLVGRVEELLRLMKEQGIETLPKGVELMDAEQVMLSLLNLLVLVDMLKKILVLLLKMKH